MLHEKYSHTIVLNTPHSVPGQFLTLVGYSSVLPKNHWSQTIYIRIMISITMMIQPPIELCLSMFAGCMISEFLGCCTCTCLQQNIVFKNITKKLIQNMWGEQSFVIFTNETQQNDLFVVNLSKMASC